MIRVLICLFFAFPAMAQTVSTGAGLRAALQEASPGAVITLEAGDYGALDWTGGQGVTLRGQGTFAGFVLREAQDIRLEGLGFVYAAPAGAPDHVRPFVVENSRGVTFDRVRFQGGAKGYGLQVIQSRDVTFQNARVEGFLRGIVVQDSVDIAILDTEFTGQRSDGLNFAAVQGVTIAGNYIHDFDRDPSADDHADMIQFWTRGTATPSRDITITGNLLDAGGGLWTQSIFMRNEAVEAGAADMAYRDVLIAGNTIRNAHLHGITVGQTQGLTIRDNRVLQRPEAAGGTANPSLWVPIITVDPSADDVTITGNRVAKIAGPAGQVAGNIAP